MSDSVETETAQQQQPEAAKFVSDERVQYAIGIVRKAIRKFGNRGLTGQEAKQIPVFVEIALRADEHYRRDRAGFPPNGDGQAFEAGRTYRSTNGTFLFTVERVVDGIALGRESHVPGTRCSLPHQDEQVWKSVMAEGCWAEVTGEHA